MSYKPPIFKKEEFNCPICKAFSHQIWNHYYYGSTHMGVVLSSRNKRSTRIPNSDLNKEKINKTELADISISFCMNCKKHSIWIDKKMIYPSDSIAPLATENIPIDILKDYNEARDVFEKSPKSSAALLRLAIQKLCIHLGGHGKNLNKDIGFLVREKGLPKKIQKSLDIVRVVGNNAVHPGTINLDDNPKIAISLFKLVNLIVDTMITQPQEIEELYKILPETTKNSIEKRDKK